MFPSYLSREFQYLENYFISRNTLQEIHSKINGNTWKWLSGKLENLQGKLILDRVSSLRPNSSRFYILFCDSKIPKSLSSCLYCIQSLQELVQLPLRDTVSTQGHMFSIGQQAKIPPLQGYTKYYEPKTSSQVSSCCEPHHGLDQLSRPARKGHMAQSKQMMTKLSLLDHCWLDIFNYSCQFYSNYKQRFKLVVVTSSSRGVLKMLKRIF